MKRPYQNTQDQVNFFVGIEVEQTPAFGSRTLFVVGVQPVDEIVKLAEDNKVDHIYLGANQSFAVGDWSAGEDPASQNWVKMIDDLFDRWKKWITLDVDVKDLVWVAEGCWCEYNTFIPMISVKMPYIRLLNVNAVLKIDDVTFEHSNPGVWCHPVTDLTVSPNFTHWSKYTKDQII